MTLNLKNVLFHKLMAPTENNLENNEELWKLAFEASGDGVWDWNIQTGQCLFSKGLLNILGFSEEEIPSRIEEWETRVHPEDLTQVMADMQAYLDGKKVSYSNEHRLKSKDGSWRWILDRGAVVERDRDGKLLRLVGTTVDITEKKQFEAKIKNSEERMKRAQSLAHVGDWERDLITNQLTWSDEMYKLIGFAPGDAQCTYQSFLAHVHSDDRQTLLDLTAKTAQEGTPYKAEYRVIHDDGEILYIEATAQISRDEDGQPIRLIGSAQDITERKLAEQALITSENKYRRLFEAAQDGILILNVETGIIENANPFLKKLLGYSEEQLLNKKIWEIGALKDLVANKEKFLELQQKGFVRYLDLPLETASGKKIDVEFVSNVYLLNSQRVVQCNIRDITERKKLERERAALLIREKEARLVAENANLTKDQFLATLSHELRTPLTAILSWAQLIQMGKLDAKTSKHGIEAIEQSAKAQSQLIGDLLDVSRIQAGKLSLNIQNIDLSQVISAAIETTRNLALSKSIQIEVEIEIDPLVKNIFADPVRFQQILWNLVTNSVKFSPPGGQIWIRVKRLKSSDGDLIQIQVKDNGKGIKPNFIPIIFERFTQVDSSSTRSYGGLGLGLSIVKKLTEMHGGTVTAESPGENKGATFTVSLPVKPMNGE